MSTDEMKNTIRAAAAAWKAEDLDGFLSMFDPSIVHHGLGPEPLDEEGTRAVYEHMAAAFPGSEIVLDDMIGEEDRVAVRFHLSGEHKGDFMGIAATGRPIVMNAQTIMRFKGGRVVERWMTADMAGLMSQLN